MEKQIAIPISTADSDFKDLAFTIDWPVEKTKTPGLVVHKELWAEGEGKFQPFKKSKRAGYWWTVAHEASGSRVLNMIESNKLAHQVAEALGALDWTVDVDTARASAKEYRQLIVEVAIDFDLY